MNLIRMARLAAWVASAALALQLAGCGSTKLKEDPNSPEAVEKLYADAKEDIANGSLEPAIKKLERVEGRAAGTVLAQQAQLDLAYAHYKGGERPEALATLDRFIKLHPNDNLGILGDLARQDLSERDQQASRDAYQSFRQLVDQFPQSKYSDDARVRMDYIVNALAEYELHVARYYFRRGAYVAAANRAKQAVTEFQQVPATEEALYIMARSYDRLGLDTLRDDADRVLRKNFPDSRFSAEGVRVRSKAWWQFW